MRHLPFIILTILILSSVYSVQNTSYEEIINPDNDHKITSGNNNQISIDQDPRIFDGNGFQPLYTDPITVKGYDVVRWGDLPIADIYDYSDDALVPVKDGKLQVIYPELIRTSTPFKSKHFVDHLSFEEIRQVPTISWEPDFVTRKSYIPNDLNLTDQWVVDRLNMTQVWDIQKGGSNVLVAVLDTGVDYNHPDLAANYLDIGYDFVNNDADVMDGDGHGTHVAGSIAATINNAIGIAGLANVSFFSQKILDDTGSGLYSDAITAIYNATDAGADILSNSWGGPDFSQGLQDAINYAHSNGVLFIAAAGNDASSAEHYPAALDNVIAVTSTDPDDSLSSFSNYGDWVDIAAPGRDILSTLPGNNYAYYSGTSMATPHVSAVAALIWSQFPGYSHTHVQNHLFSTTVDIGSPGFDIQFGHGLVSPYNAMAPLDDYDIDLTISQVGYLESDQSRTFKLTAVNLGAQDLFNLNLTLNLNGSLLTTLENIDIVSGQSYEYTTVIDVGKSVYNISVSVPTYPGELESENNYHALITKYSEIISPAPGIIVEEGMVLVELQSDNSTDLLPVDMLLNGAKISSFVQSSDHDYAYFPVFSLGSQNLGFEFKWVDGTFIIISIDVTISNLSPMVELSVGDEINWIYDDSDMDGTYQQQHWTVTNILPNNEAELNLYVNLFDNSTLYWEFNLYAKIDLTNGYYVTTDFGWDGQRFSWLTNINSNSSPEFYPGFYDWNHIIYTNETVIYNDRIQLLGFDGFDTIFRHDLLTGLPSTVDSNNTKGYLESSTLISYQRDFIINQDINIINYNEPEELEVVVTNGGDVIESIDSISITQGGMDLNYRILTSGDVQSIGEQMLPGDTIIIRYNLSDYSSGQFNVMVNITSTSVGQSQSIIDYLMVTVVDNIDPIISISESAYTLDLLELVTLNWIISEPNYESHQVYLQGTNLKSTLVNNTVSVDLSFSQEGTYNVTLEVVDTSGNTATSTVIITVLDQTSTTSEPTDTSSSSDQSTNSPPPRTSETSTSMTDTSETSTSTTDTEIESRTRRNDNTQGASLGFNLFWIILSIHVVVITKKIRK